MPLKNFTPDELREGDFTFGNGLEQQRSGGAVTGFFGQSRIKTPHNLLVLAQPLPNLYFDQGQYSQGDGQQVSQSPDLIIIAHI